MTLKSMNDATAASGGIAASRATSSGGPPKPARSSRCRARSGVQSEGPIDERSCSQPSVISYPCWLVPDPADVSVIMPTMRSGWQGFKIEKKNFVVLTTIDLGENLQCPFWLHVAVQ